MGVAHKRALKPMLHAVPATTPIALRRQVLDAKTIMEIEVVKPFSVSEHSVTTKPVWATTKPSTSLVNPLQSLLHLNSSSLRYLF